jgi:SAM-dependent methyltransferase
MRTRFRGSTDVETCLAEGEADALALLEPVLARLGFDPNGRRLLDLGAGFGRMFRGYAKLGFGSITGAEVSLEMARLGARWRPAPGAAFVVIDGRDLSAFRSAGFDFCVSRGVLPFQPSQRRVERLIEEIHRVLAPGGGFLLHMGGLTPTWVRRARRGLGLRWRGRSGASVLAEPPEAVLAKLRGLGCTELAVLPDPRRVPPREQRYYVAGLNPR